MKVEWEAWQRICKLISVPSSLLLIAMLTLLLDHFKSFATFFIIYHFIERENGKRNQS